MSRDVYQPCPYCTDTKIKFCCADIADDMGKIMRQLDSGQTGLALKRLEKLAETHPETVWNQIIHAMMILESGERNDDALEILERLLDAHPTNTSVGAVYATAALRHRGYDWTRAIIWYVLRKAHGRSAVLCHCLLTVSRYLATIRKFMAARGYLTVAMRYAPADSQEEIFEELVHFDGNEEIPYIVRGVHSLRAVEGSDERREAAHKAHRLAERGCFGPAADRFAKLAEEAPGDAAAEFNAGLTRAWAGEHSEASAALLRASRAEADFELATEYAALSQTLRALDAAQSRQGRQIAYQVESAECALAALSTIPEAVHRESPSLNDTSRLAFFTLADRAVPPTCEGRQLSDVPRSLGLCYVALSTTADSETTVGLNCETGDDFDGCLALLGSVVDVAAPLRESDAIYSRILPGGFEVFRPRLAFGSSDSWSTMGRFTRELIDEQFEAWLKTPQDLLDGRTPEEAAADPERRAETAALWHLIEAAIENQSNRLDEGSYRRRLGLPEPQSFTPGADESLVAVSTLQMHRLRVADLDDRQLAIVLNRERMVQNPPFYKEVLKEALARDLEQFDRLELIERLAILAQEQQDFDESLHWIAEGRQAASERESPFSAIARWDLRESVIRIAQGDSPELQEYLRKFLSYYSPKVPELVEFVINSCAARDIPLTAIQSVTADAAGPQGVWTPDRPAAASEKKLWLPDS